MMTLDVAGNVKRSLESSGRRRKPARGSRNVRFARVTFERLEERLMLAAGDEFLAATPDANSADPFIVAKAAELGHDPVQIFNFLRDEVGYESYVGSLRGARGTLWSNAGNALDQSSLMIALLRASNVPARYVHGMLPDAGAGQLIASMFPTPLRVVSCLDTGVATANPSIDPRLLAEAGDHYWVEFDADGDDIFTAADPTVPGAAISQTFAAADSSFAEVPDNLRHKATVRLDRELTIPAVSLFGGGSAQSTSTVLEHTFNTVELVGRPISLGHFVNSTTFGFIFGATTITYSPYLMVGEIGSDGTRDELIRGTDYQDVLTNFPFGSQIVTGVFLEIDLQSPDGSVERLERTLADRIGLVTRRNGGSGSLVGDPMAAALIDPLDVVTISIMPSEHYQPALDQAAAQFEAMSDEFKTFFGTFAATPEGPARDALVPQAIEQNHKAILATSRGRLTYFERQSDFDTDALQRLLLVRAYWDRPRVTIVTADVTAVAGAEPTLDLALDLREDNPRVLPFPGQASSAAVGFRITRGFAENGVETAAMGQPPALDGGEFRVATTTVRIFQAAAAQRIGFVVLSTSNRGVLETLDISDLAKLRIGDALDAGKQVIVPETAVPIVGRLEIGWYEQDLTTGETIGVLEDGSHGSIIEYFGVEVDVAARSQADQFLFGELAGLGATGIAGAAVFLFGLGVNAALPDGSIGGAVTNIKQAVMLFIQLLKGEITKQLIGKPPFFVAGFLYGFSVGIVYTADPPIGTGLLGSAPTDDFASLTGTNVAVGIVPDPLLYVSDSGAQLPTVFRAGVKNLGASRDAFTFDVTAVPAGFTAQTSVSRIDIPPGETAEISVCLRPTGELPAPGTDASFTLQVTSNSKPAITASDTETFTMPEIHGVTISADPPELATTPGVAQQTAIVLQSVGNVPENVTFTAELSNGLMLGGLAPQSLAVGELKVFFVTLTPSPDTPLNSTLTAEITASFGAPESVSVSVPINVVVPGAQAIARAAGEARRIGNLDLGNRLDDLSVTLTNLVQDCSSDVFKSQSLAALDGVIGLLGVDSILVTFVDPLTAARDQLAAAANEPECLAAVNNLGQTLDGFGDTVFNISEHNVEAFLLPNSQVAQPQTPTQFELRIHNISASVVSTTYNVTLGNLPPGVSGMLSQNSVTLARDEFASVTVTITQGSATELLPFDFDVTVSADGFPDIARTVHGSFTARNEFVSIVSVTATPPFTDAGGQLAVAARVLNVVNREQFARASFVVKDSSGVQVGPSSTPVDVMLTVQSSLVNVPLGMIDTTGFMNGSHTIEVTLTDMTGQPIPGATGIGTFLVGSPVTASIDVAPDVLPPGTSTVTNTLAIEAIGPVASTKPITLLSVQPIFRARGVATRNNLAYVCGFFGIEIIDYSDPSNPVVQGTIPGGYSGCRIQDNVLLAMRPVGREFILDVYALQNTPLAPPRIGGSDVIRYALQTDLQSISGHALVTQFNICFFIFSADIYHQAGDLLSIALNLDDVNNPTTAAPALESVLFNTNGDTSFDPTDVGGCAENGGDHNVWNVALPNSQTAYLATTTAAGDDTQAGIGRVQVVDIANPASPAVVRELDIPGTVQAIGIAVSGNTGVVIGSTRGFQDNPNGLLLGTLTLTTLDLTDPRDPQIVASRTLNRRSGTLLTNTATIGNGLFAFSNQGFDGTIDHPAVLLIDATNPNNPVVTETAIPLQHMPQNSLFADDDLLFTTDDSGLSIYRIGDIPGLPLTARVQVPNGTGVAIVAGSFNTPPTAIIPGVDFDTLVWDVTLTSPNQIETFLWNSIVSGMQPGESRAVTLGTTVDFAFQGTSGQALLPPEFVVSEQIVALDPATRTVRPGEPATYTLTLRNPAASSVTYDLSLQGVPPEWVDLPTSVMVPAGASADVSLILTSDPFAALGEFGFVVTASAATGAAGSVHGSLILDGEPVLPDPESHGIVLTISPDHATAGQGTAANFVLRLTNTGSATDTFMLSANLPAGFVGTFQQPSVEVPPGASNFREMSLMIVAAHGTLPGNYDFSVTAASTTQDDSSDIANSRAVIVGAGVDVSLSAASVAPGGTLQLTVTNTGQAAGTFDLALAGPAVLVATLGTTSVTLASGASRIVPIAIGGVDFAVPGPLLLTATATARSEPAVSDRATAAVNIPTTTGLAAEFTPATMDLPAPGPTSFLLMVENLGNTEDAYTSTIMSTSGPVAASLIGLDGLPAQTVPIFRLPGLATGAILVNANLMAFGQGTIHVNVRSQSHAGVVAAAVASVSSGQPACSVTPTARGVVPGAGNVSVQVNAGRLVITGDKLIDDVRVEAGSEANSFCITGNAGTTVNGQTGAVVVRGVTGSVTAILSGSRDAITFDGRTRAIVLPGDLTIRMNSRADMVRLDHVTVTGRSLLRTGRGKDLIEVLDSVFAGRTVIRPGAGDDRVAIHDTVSRADLLLDGYLGEDSLDAGLLRRPNANRNQFGRVITLGFERMSS